MLEFAFRADRQTWAVGAKGRTLIVRTLYHIVAGIGAGILGPIALYFLFTLLDGTKGNEGVGTPFAIMMIVTVPLGMMFGAAWGVARAHPDKAPRMTKSVRFGDLAASFGDVPADEYRRTVSRMLSHRLMEYREWERYQLIIAAAMLLGGVLGVRLFLLILLPLSVSWAWKIFLARRELRAVEAYWGHEMIAEQGVLPFTLRVSWDSVDWEWLRNKLRRRDG
jgi:hypothetical protein